MLIFDSPNSSPTRLFFTRGLDQTLSSVKFDSLFSFCHLIFYCFLLSLGASTLSPLSPFFFLHLTQNFKHFACLQISSLFLNYWNMDQRCSDSSSDAANEEFWNLANSSSDEELMNLQIIAIQENGRRRRRGSVPGRRLLMNLQIIASLINTVSDAVISLLRFL
ncbi:hypothetical protein RchiOBHm_Chr4g0394851 [Rosa chinensis]|uniref:Uncharacterized protein n=1 Tax=Rosa chinensis TaxID=74649 RepID=A0A2P6QRC4_ROSCH|nr:hypothetical protein RchiOBHm_Chr4g0394851 [Rosa chinensis]